MCVGLYCCNVLLLSLCFLYVFIVYLSFVFFNFVLPHGVIKNDKIRIMVNRYRTIYDDGIHYRILPHSAHHQPTCRPYIWNANRLSRQRAIIRLTSLLPVARVSFFYSRRKAVAKSLSRRWMLNRRKHGRARQSIKLPLTTPAAP